MVISYTRDMEERISRIMDSKEYKANKGHDSCPFCLETDMVTEQITESFNGVSCNTCNNIWLEQD